MWLANSLFDVTFIIIGMHVTNLGYLKDGSLCFTEFSDGGMDKSNKILVRLDIAAVILEINNQNLLNLINLKAEWVNKKKEKVE